MFLAKKQAKSFLNIYSKIQIFRIFIAIKLWVYCFTLSWQISRRVTAFTVFGRYITNYQAEVQLCVEELPTLRCSVSCKNKMYLTLF